MRISKEITSFASGKDEDFQPERRSKQSPGVGEQGRELLHRRTAEIPTVGDKHACHSDVSPERTHAEDVQAEADAEA